MLCVDVGSTWTKIALIDLGARRLVATGAAPTTVTTDVLDGLRAAVDQLGSRHPGTGLDAGLDGVLVCSSAGGGLRIAVIGNEAAVTGEAGRRAALSSGGQVVATVTGALSPRRLEKLDQATPDLVLLTGGTDGGNTQQILAAACVLADHGWSTPVVVAGNRDVADEVVSVLRAADVPHVVVANLVPRIGELDPEPARQAIRTLFLSHVIGGKRLSADPAFARLVVGATPDVVLSAVEVLGSRVPGGVLVVDVGGATTDVYSCVPPDPAATTPTRELIGSTPALRTVEGDLGVAASARSTLEQGRAAGLLPDGTADDPGSDELTQVATTLAVSRHVGRSESTLVAGRRLVRTVGPDLRTVPAVIGSGGVFRADPRAGRTILTAALAAAAGPGRLLPAVAKPMIDDDYLLAPIGLLASRHPDVAAALADQLVVAGSARV